MNDWQIVLYWASLVVLWILIGLNFWTTRRSWRTWKTQKKQLEELEKTNDEYRSLRDTYVKLLAEQQERKD